jgi:hypothetical protein
VVPSWNSLRETWGLTSETLLKIYDSCITQRQLEKTHIFTPTRHILPVIKRIWNIARTHSGLPAVAKTTFSLTSRNKETETTSMSDLMDEQSKDDSGETEYMWDSTDEQGEEDTKKTAYMWDSMDEQVREDIMDMIKQTDKLDGSYGSLKTNGPPLYRQWASTNFSTSTNTSKTSAGDLTFI